MKERKENIRPNGGKYLPLSEDRIKKYQRLLSAWVKYCADHGIEFVHQFTPEHCQRFRKTWKDDPMKKAFPRKNENFKTIFEYFIEEHWISKNPVYTVEEHEFDEDFTTDEYVIKDSAWQCMKANVANLDPRSVDRLRAQLLFGWESGCRISDIVSLERAHINFETKMYDRPAKKNRKRNYGPLSDECLAALRQIPDNGTKYFWWSGNGHLKSAIADARRPISKLLNHCKSIKFHPHMFRHTRITKRLESGMDFQTVAHMVGDTEAVIRRHYWHASKDYKKRVSDEARKTL